MRPPGPTRTRAGTTAAAAPSDCASRRRALAGAGTGPRRPRTHVNCRALAPREAPSAPTASPPRARRGSRVQTAAVPLSGSTKARGTATRARASAVQNQGTGSHATATASPRGSRSFSNNERNHRSLVPFGPCTPDPERRPGASATAPAPRAARLNRALARKSNSRQFQSSASPRLPSTTNNPRR